MILPIISIIISPLLIFKNVIIYSSLNSLLITYTKDKKTYIIKSAIIGLLFDIFYSKYYINVFLFPLISLIISYYFTEKKYTLKNLIILSMFIIFIYNTFLYLVLNILSISIYNYTYFLTNLLYIYIINIIYISLLYLFIKKKK